MQSRLYDNAANENVTTVTGLVRTAKALMRRIPILAFLLVLYEGYRDKRAYQRWIQNGSPVPPPHLVKRQVVRNYAAKLGLSVFIETGTYKGDMVDAVKDIFDEIYSIELEVALYQQAKKRFADDKHITILQGDSGSLLGGVLARLDKPCLFWLDGHYSGGATAKGDLDTPIQRELAHIFKHSAAHSHVILIDDARLFTGDGDYPSIQTLKNLTARAGFDAFEVKDDIIRVYRQAQSVSCRKPGLVDGL